MNFGDKQRNKNSLTRCSITSPQILTEHFYALSVLLEAELKIMTTINIICVHLGLSLVGGTHCKNTSYMLGK